MTVKKLQSFTLNFHIRGKTIRGNPDGLYNQFISLTRLLPALHVNIWGINLFSQFWEALGDDLTRRISMSFRYLAIHHEVFDLTMMGTKTRQMAALRELRTLAVECYATLEDGSAMFYEMAPSCYQHPPTSSHHLDSSVHVSLFR
jgi:hypothetical protein